MGSSRALWIGRTAAFTSTSHDKSCRPAGAVTCQELLGHLASRWRARFALPALRNPSRTSCDLHQRALRDGVAQVGLLSRVERGFGEHRHHFGEPLRSEERRVGKECRSRWSACHEKKKTIKQEDAERVYSS